MLFSQETRIELGDKYYNQFAYKKAIKLYEGAVNRGNNQWEVYARLGECYYNTSQPKKAFKYFELAISKKKNIKASYLLKYALSLQSSGRSQDSVISAFKEYYKKIGVTDSISRRTSVADSNVELENLSINSAFSDFGTFIHKDTLFFSSSRKNPAKKKQHNKRLYKWNEHPFLDIYSAKINREANSISFMMISSDSSNISINTNAHESSVAITNDGKTMYFTGGVVNKKGKLKYNKNGTSTLKLQRATLINNNWVITEADRKALDFLNYDFYSFGNPALSPDNKRLFFVTCAPFPDAKGQTDIYYVDILDDGTYGKVENLKEVNTSGRESFPYISPDGSLYFSSDGIYENKLSLGLLDIYKVEDVDRVIQKKKEVKIDHMESPINSNKDDFAFFIEESKENSNCEFYAYFSSNRDVPSAKGDDDIYRVKVKINKTIQGVVTDYSTKKPLANASVDLIDFEGKVIKTIQVDSSGIYKFDVECDQFYRLRGSMTRYDDDLEESNSDEHKEVINLQLTPYPCEIPVDHIEFDLDSDAISFDAKVALLPVIELLLTNPDIKIRIESHTDSQGSPEYNRSLSERRAQSTKSYLISIGVKESQIISAKGFGEDCLLKSDEEIRNLPTDEEKDRAHKENRRSRFIIDDCNDNIEGC